VSIADVVGEARGEELPLEDLDAELGGHLGEVMEVLVGLEVLATPNSDFELERRKGGKKWKSTRQTRS
jgi:hypothetical protein